jgi:uncharacterized membrane protein
MTTGRLEAFSDAVIAIILTIMVLELGVPHEADFTALLPLMPVFISYILSFIYLGIYWNNHHHLLKAAKKINGHVLWANMFLLFWLSLIPFGTAWMGETNFAFAPVVVYGVILVMNAVAYYILDRVLLSIPENQGLKRAIGPVTKERVSIVIYIVGILLAFINPWIAFAAYAIVAAIWFIPDPRIEAKPEIIEE